MHLYNASATKKIDHLKINKNIFFSRPGVILMIH